MADMLIHTPTIKDGPPHLVDSVLYTDRLGDSMSVTHTLDQVTVLVHEDEVNHRDDRRAMVVMLNAEQVDDLIARLTRMRGRM